jgi:hypothetical protein
MKYLRTILVALTILGLSVSSSAQSYDPGQPDTLRIESAVIPVGVSAPVAISIWNDSVVAVFDIGLEIAELDSGFAQFDSVRYVGRMADPTVLSWRILNNTSVNGVSPDSLVFGCMQFVDLPLPPGDGPVLELFFTGLEAGLMALDIPRVGAHGRPLFGTQGSRDYFPVFVSGSCQVVAGVCSPVLAFPDGRFFAAPFGESISFAVSASSPSQYPVVVTLNGLFSSDDSTQTPLRLPQFDQSGQFVWTPTFNDVGIWVAEFIAVDSAGSSSRAEVGIQIVSNRNYLTELSCNETPTSIVATGIAHGDFDRDEHPEIIVSAASIESDQTFAVFRPISDGQLEEVLILREETVDRGPAVGLLNGDNYLDVVLYHGPFVRVLKGDGDLFTYHDSDSIMIPFFRDAALLDFNGDEHLDYVCATLRGVVVFNGMPDANFADPFWFLTGDSVLSVSGADFNQDGYDDLAVGTTAGVKVYLNDQHGSYSPGEFYPQAYGAVDIEVTTRGSDFNNDGLFDLCLATPSVGGTYSELVVYLGLGNGTFQPVLVRRVQGQIFASLPGDFNGDGYLDIAYANGARKYVGIVFGDGTGGFLNERRYPVPRYSPRRMDCLDIDVDGDLDLVIASHEFGLGVQSSLFVYLNQTDPPDVQPDRLEIRAANNIDMQLLTPHGGRLSRIANSTASGDLYLTGLDDNSRLDMVAVSSTVESGRYEIITSPRRNVPLEESFSLSYRVGSRDYRIAENLTAGQYVFPLYPGTASPYFPAQGEFVNSPMPTFTWPSSGPERFELAADISFNNVIEAASISSGAYTLQMMLPDNDSTPYFWRVRPESGETNDVFVFNAINAPTGVEGHDSDGLLPDRCWLEQNYPNPFNPLTTIRYHLPYGAHVIITVHNVLGQVIRTLIDQAIPSGDHSVEWDATDVLGRPVASGVYFYRMTAGEASFTRKMTLIR